MIYNNKISDNGASIQQKLVSRLPSESLHQHEKITLTKDLITKRYHISKSISSNINAIRQCNRWITI